MNLILIVFSVISIFSIINARVLKREANVIEAETIRKPIINETVTPPTLETAPASTEAQRKSENGTEAPPPPPSNVKLKPPESTSTSQADIKDEDILAEYGHVELMKVATTTESPVEESTKEVPSNTKVPRTARILTTTPKISSILPPAISKTENPNSTNQKLSSENQTENRLPEVEAGRGGPEAETTDDESLHFDINEYIEKPTEFSTLMSTRKPTAKKLEDFETFHTIDYEKTFERIVLTTPPGFIDPKADGRKYEENDSTEWNYTFQLTTEKPIKIDEISSNSTLEKNRTIKFEDKEIESTNYIIGSDELKNSTINTQSTIPNGGDGGKRGKFINGNLTIPNTAEAWALASMKTVEHTKEKEGYFINITSELAKPDKNMTMATKQLTDWTEIMKTSEFNNSFTSNANSIENTLETEGIKPHPKVKEQLEQENQVVPVIIKAPPPPPTTTIRVDNNIERLTQAQVDLDNDILNTSTPSMIKVPNLSEPKTSGENIIVKAPMNYEQIDNKIVSKTPMLIVSTMVPPVMVSTSTEKIETTLTTSSTEIDIEKNTVPSIGSKDGLVDKNITTPTANTQKVASSTLTSPHEEDVLETVSTTPRIINSPSTPTMQVITSLPSSLAPSIIAPLTTTTPSELPSRTTIETTQNSVETLETTTISIEQNKIDQIDSNNFDSVLVNASQNIDDSKTNEKMIVDETTSNLDVFSSTPFEIIKTTTDSDQTTGAVSVESETKVMENTTGMEDVSETTEDGTVSMMSTSTVGYVESTMKTQSQEMTTLMESASTTYSEMELPESTPRMTTISYLSTSTTSNLTTITTTDKSDGLDTTEFINGSTTNSETEFGESTTMDYLSTSMASNLTETTDASETTESITGSTVTNETSDTELPEKSTTETTVETNNLDKIIASTTDFIVPKTIPETTTTTTEANDSGFTGDSFEQVSTAQSVVSQPQEEYTVHRPIFRITTSERPSTSSSPETAVTEPIENSEDEGTDYNIIIAISVSVVGIISLILLVGFLYVMRKRQKQLTYGQRCRPVSLDAYSLDNISVYNSVRRKGILRTSKRTYGNAAFDDPSLKHNVLTVHGLAKFVENKSAIREEFADVPQIIARADEVPPGCEDKNRYANVVPLPETRVFLEKQNGDEKTEYINANFVRGPKDTPNYYIACQAPMESTVGDFWRMMWEQNSRVIIMATDLIENGIEKCAEYLPPSMTLDNHTVYGDFQITLKNREVKDKYAVSTLHLKNMLSNTWREITHFWYQWPETGVPIDEASVIAMLLEARSYLKMTTQEQTDNNENDSTIEGSNGIDKTKPSSRTQGPLTVHCSPGTGRTGTIISCDIALRSLETPRRTVDIPQIVYYVRRGRASAVQTKEQYEFIYKVTYVYATKITAPINDN